MKFIVFSDVSAMKWIPQAQADKFNITMHVSKLSSYLDTLTDVSLYRVDIDAKSVYDLLESGDPEFFTKYPDENWENLTWDVVYDLDTKVHYVAMEGNSFLLFTPKGNIDYKERFEKLQVLTTQFFKAAGSYSSAIEIDSHVKGYISGDEFEKQIRELLNLPSEES